MSRRGLLAIATVVFCAAAVWTCSQGEGERCQLDDDCESLYCCKCAGPAAEPVTSGICLAGRAACDRHCGVEGADADADADTDAGADGDAADAERDAESSAEAEADAEPETDAEAEAEPDAPADAPADVDETAGDSTEETAD